MTTPGSSAPLRVGVIGCGRVARDRHVPIAASMEGVELKAICDISPETRSALKEQYGLDEVHDSYQTLLDLDSVDAVMIATPTEYHAEIGLAALAADKHVMIEKPLALSLSDVDRLEEAAAQHGKTVAVAMNSRWHRLVREARQRIRDGQIGEVGLVRSAFTDDYRIEKEPPPWMMQHEQGGCVLVETAVHHFDLWPFVLDTEVESIHATMQDPMTQGERAAVTATLANGVVVSAMFTEGLKGMNELEFFGKDGKLKVSVYDFDGLSVSSRSDYPGTLGPRIRQFKESLLAFPGAFQRRKTGGDWVGSYRTEWQHFVDCIREGRPVECGLPEGRRALSVSLAAMESLQRGAPVRIADAPDKVVAYTG